MSTEKRIQGLQLDVPGERLKEIVVNIANGWRGMAEDERKGEAQLKEAQTLAGSRGHVHEHHAYRGPFEAKLADQFDLAVRNMDLMAEFIDVKAMYVLTPADFAALNSMQANSIKAALGLGAGALC